MSEHGVPNMIQTGTLIQCTQGRTIFWGQLVWYLPPPTMMRLLSTAPQRSLTQWHWLLQWRSLLLSSRPCLLRWPPRHSKTRFATLVFINCVSVSAAWRRQSRQPNVMVVPRPSKRRPLGRHQAHDQVPHAQTSRYSMRTNHATPCSLIPC